MHQELQIQPSNSDQLHYSLSESQHQSIQQPQKQQESVCELDFDELYRSVLLVRQLIGELAEDRALSVPTCVQQYCQRMSRYKVDTTQQILQIAQRRASKMMKNHKVKKNWNVEDVILLIWLVSKRIQMQNYHNFSEMSINDWQFISSMISATTWQKCKFKWLALKKIKLLNHKWSNIESKILAEILSTTNRFNWNSIAEQLYQKNPSHPKVFRTPKQCRQHWNCFINPKIQKGPWNFEEDRKLIEYVLQLQGLKKWSEISKYMQGRTQNALKNRYNLLLKKQRKLSGNLTEKRLVKLCLNRLLMEQNQLERQISEVSAHEQLPSELNLQRNIPVEKNSSKTQVNKLPLVPTIPQPLNYIPNSLNFNISYNGFQSHFGVNPTNFIFSTPIADTNGYYIRFIYQGN